MISEKRNDLGTGEAIGSWSLQLKPSTPHDVLARLDLSKATARYAVLAITRSRVSPANISAANIRAIACYAGVYTSRTSNLVLAGSGLATLLGDAQGKCEMPTANVSLSASTMSAALANYIPSNGITTGTITNTGTNITAILPSYTSRRDLVQQIVDTCAGEWRITTDSSGNFVLDAAANATLFGSAATALVIKNEGGRHPGVIGLRATQLDQAQDIDDFVTTQYVLARGDGGMSVGSAVNGAGSSVVNGTTLKMEAVADSSRTTAANKNIQATTLLNLRSGSRRAFRVQVNPVDVVGHTWAPSGTNAVSTRCGDQIYIYDPSMDIYDTSNQVIYRGRTVFPLKTRVFGISWPVLPGMGVYLITAEASPTIIDLSDWYVPETGDATIDVGAQVRRITTPQYLAPIGPTGAVPTAISTDAWASHSPALVQSAGVSGTVSWSRYQRIGRTIIWTFIISVTGSGTAGNAITVSLPAAAAAPASTGIGFGDIIDASAGAAGVWTGVWRLQTSTTVALLITGSTGMVGANPSFALAAGDEIAGTLTYEASTS